MKKNIIILGTLLISGVAFSQVGIDTETPKATLDVMAKPTDLTKTDGFIAPRVKGSELKAKDSNYAADQTGAIVYVTEALAIANVTPKTTNVTSIGYYYFDGAIWVKFNPEVTVSNDWHITGNAGTDQETNFIGTTDNQSLRFKVNNVKSGWIGKDASDNTSLGYNSLTGSSFSTPGSARNNVAIGMNTLSSATSAFTWSNIAIGNNALKNATDPRYNVAIGDNAQINTTTARNNVSVGVTSLGSATTGGLNTAVGGTALATLTTGAANNAFGLTALQNVISGNANIGIGQLAGSTITTGSYNTVIGNYNTNVPNVMGNRQLNIGDLITGTGLGSGVFAETNATAQEKIQKVGIAQASNVISEVLDVNGTTRLRTLPNDGATNAIYTQTNGTTSATKNQTFTATKTVVADANGVLGVVNGTLLNTGSWFQKTLPTTLASANGQNIYTNGSVSIGGINSTGTLTVLNSAATNNAIDFSMIANRASGNPATLNFISNLGSGSWSSLSLAGDKALVFSTDGDPGAYSRNAFQIVPHSNAGGQAPFGFKITEQGLSSINVQIPTETFDVNGTFRIRQLPLDGSTNSIFSKPDGSTSLPATTDISGLVKTQTFVAARTVVASSNGVLGHVDGLPVTKKSNGQVVIENLPVFENNVDASSLPTGTLYRTSTGVLMIKF